MFVCVCVCVHERERERESERERERAFTISVSQHVLDVSTYIYTTTTVGKVGCQVKFAITSNQNILMKFPTLKLLIDI